MTSRPSHNLESNLRWEKWGRAEIPRFPLLALLSPVFYVKATTNWEAVPLHIPSFLGLGPIAPILLSPSVGSGALLNCEIRAAGYPMHMPCRIVTFHIRPCIVVFTILMLLSIVIMLSFSLHCRVLSYKHVTLKVLKTWLLHESCPNHLWMSPISEMTTTAFSRQLSRCGLPHDPISVARHRSACWK